MSIKDKAREDYQQPRKIQLRDVEETEITAKLSYSH